MDLGENKIQHDKKPTRSRVKIPAMDQKREQWTIVETFLKKEHSTKDPTLWSRRYVHEKKLREGAFNERPYTGANVAYKREHKIRSISRVNCHCAINVKKWWTLMLSEKGATWTLWSEMKIRFNA